MLFDKNRMPIRVQYPFKYDSLIIAAQHAVPMCRKFLFRILFSSIPQFEVYVIVMLDGHSRLCRYIELG